MEVGVKWVIVIYLKEQEGELRVLWNVKTFVELMTMDHLDVNAVCDYQ